MVRSVPDIRAIVEEANVGAENINWNGTPRAIWASVLHEERNQKRVGAIFRVLAVRYPENEEFWQAGMEYVGRAIKDGSDSQTLMDMAGSTADLVDTLHKFQESIRAEMRLMEERINKRIDESVGGLSSRLDIAVAQINVMTPFKRTAWILGFILFTLPMPLFIKDIRDQLGIAPGAVLLISLIFWSFSLMAFLYGLGFVRDGR